MIIGKLIIQIMNGELVMQITNGELIIITSGELITQIIIKMRIQIQIIMVGEISTMMTIIIREKILGVKLKKTKIKITT